MGEKADVPASFMRLTAALLSPFANLALFAVPSVPGRGSARESRISLAGSFVSGDAANSKLDMHVSGSGKVQGDAALSF